MDVAKTLNMERVPSPRPREGKTLQAWSTSCIQPLLRNPRYMGWSIWNQHQKVTGPATGKKTMRPRPESEWVRVEKPDWRIVSEDLWNGVQKRIEDVNSGMGAQRQGGLNRASKGPGYVFSGLLLCGLCGARLVISGGDVSNGEEKYACPDYRCRGVCENNLYIRRDRLEAQLFGALEKQLFRPESLDRIVSAVVAAFAQRKKEAKNGAGASQVQRLNQRLKEVEVGTDAIAHALAELKDSRALMDKLRALEVEKAAIHLELANQREVEQEVTEDQTRQYVINTVLTLRQKISDSDVPSARAAFQRHLLALDQKRGQPVLSGLIKQSWEKRFDQL